MDTYNSRRVEDIPNSLILSRDIFLTECNKYETMFPNWSHSKYYHMLIASPDTTITCASSEKDMSPIEYIYNVIGVPIEQLSELSVFLLRNLNKIDMICTFVILCTNELNGIMILFENSTKVCRNCGETANLICSGCKLARFCSKMCQASYWTLHELQCITCM